MPLPKTYNTTDPKEQEMEDSRVAVTVTGLKPHRKSLVGVEEGGCKTQEYC